MSNNRKGGRPPKASCDKRRQRSLKASNAEWSEIEKKACAVGLPTRTFIREAALQKWGLRACLIDRLEMLVIGTGQELTALMERGENKELLRREDFDTVGQYLHDLLKTIRQARAEDSSEDLTTALRKELEEADKRQPAESKT